jgi:hypothetical protein
VHTAPAARSIAERLCDGCEEQVAESGEAEDGPTVIAASWASFPHRSCWLRQKKTLAVRASASPSSVYASLGYSAALCWPLAVLRCDLRKIARSRGHILMVGIGPRTLLKLMRPRYSTHAFGATCSSRILEGGTGAELDGRLARWE